MPGQIGPTRDIDQPSAAIDPARPANPIVDMRPLAGRLAEQELQQLAQNSGGQHRDVVTISREKR